MRRARDSGVAVRAWTANTAADIDRLLAWGVHGIITDRPDLARALADGAASATPALAA